MMSSEYHSLQLTDNTDFLLPTENFASGNFHDFIFDEDINNRNTENMKDCRTQASCKDIVPATVPLNTLPPLPHRMLNRNIVFVSSKRRGSWKTPPQNDRCNSPFGYESDESCHSFLSSYKDGCRNNVRHSDLDLYNQSLMFRKLSHSSPNMSQDENNRENVSQQANRKFNRKQKYRQPKQHRWDARDIKRRVFGLMGRFTSKAQSFNIDPNPTGLLTGSPFDHLNHSIWEVYFVRAQKADTYLKKLNLWEKVYLEMNKGLSKFGLFLVGSTMSGLGTEDSDIDMCLLVKTPTADHRSHAIAYLTQIREILENCNFVLCPRVIPAKVPILKFRGAQDGFEVDLNCNNSVGIRNTHLLHCYVEMDWRVRPLIIIVKLWAQAQNINDAKKMTISSYSLSLMVIHYLQCGVAPPVVPCLHGLHPGKFSLTTEIYSIDIQELLPKFKSDNKLSLGELLIGFLQYYTYFNYSNFAISVRSGSRLPIDECRYTRAPKNDPHQWKYLCIEEPFDLTNTARSVYDAMEFKRIKDVFYNSYKVLSGTYNLRNILMTTDDRS